MGGRRVGGVLYELVSQSVELPGGKLRVLQPEEAVELPDDGAVEWAPLAPYWAVLWRSGVALAGELDGEPLRGLSVVELGCGLGVPSLAAARAGASVLATDSAPEALELVARSARANALRVETALVDWAEPGDLVRRAPFDIVVAADVLYEARNGEALLPLLPRLLARRGEVWLADPGRPAAQRFLAAAAAAFTVDTRAAAELPRGGVHRLRLA